MSVGFRKSLFGFNADDVMNYIEKMHKSYAKKESEFKSSISDLKDELADASEKINLLEESNLKLKKELDELNATREKSERLSQSIGKLYVVAQASAKSIMENSRENSRLSKEEVEKNISALTDAQESLNELKTDIETTAANFSKEVARLMSELDSTKSRICRNVSDSEDKSKSFEIAFSEITSQS